MAIQRLAVILCLLTSVGVLGAAASGAWDWRVNPTSPSVGDPMEVVVDDAPAVPVKVEIWIGGTLKFSQTLTEIPGSVSYVVPAGSSGQPYEVQVSTASSSSNAGGTIL